MRIRSHQRQLYEQCTFESVIVLGSAIARLLRENPSALSILNNPKMAELVPSSITLFLESMKSPLWIDMDYASLFHVYILKSGRIFYCLAEKAVWSDLVRLVYFVWRNGQHSLRPLSFYSRPGMLCSYKD